MAYVGNIVAFVKYLIDHVVVGYNVFNYVDKPDNNMNQLVAHVSKVLDRHIPATHFPYWLGMFGGSNLTNGFLGYSANGRERFLREERRTKDGEPS